MLPLGYYKWSIVADTHSPISTGSCVYGVHSQKQTSQTNRKCYSIFKKFHFYPTIDFNVDVLKMGPSLGCKNYMYYLRNRSRLFHRRFLLVSLQICPWMMSNVLYYRRNQHSCKFHSPNYRSRRDAFILLATDDTRILIELFRYYLLLISLLFQDFCAPLLLQDNTAKFGWMPYILHQNSLIELISSCAAQPMVWTDLGVLFYVAILLMSTINAVETILRIDDSLCELWCNENLLGSLQEAQKQMW